MHIAPTIVDRMSATEKDAYKGITLLEGIANGDAVPEIREAYDLIAPLLEQYLRGTAKKLQK